MALETKNKIIAVLAVGLISFHVYTALSGVLPGIYQRAYHWLFVVCLVFLVKPLPQKGMLFRIVDGLLLLGGALSSVYIIYSYEDVLLRLGSPTTLDVIFSAIALITVLEAARRMLGWALPLLALAALFYTHFGPYFPGLLRHSGQPVERIITFMYQTTDGIWGIPLGSCATFIVLFLLFGAFLEVTGAGQWFFKMAHALTGRFRGGPAQAAVLSSMFMGSMSGSSIANAVTTGTFTIPLMKKVGYRPTFAAAVETVASSGGQLMPPVMGAAAFIMADYIGVPYVQVAKAALIPSLLYFLVLSVVVFLEAYRLDIKPLPASELPRIKETMMSGLQYLIPLLILIYLLALGLSPMRVALFATFAVIGVSLVQSAVTKQKINLQDYVAALIKAGRGILPVATACAAAGLIIGSTTITGLGLRLTNLIVSVSGGEVFIALIMTMLVSIVLGIGLPTAAAYIVLAVLGGPALIKMGVPPLAAHLFILYFGAVSTITPPVALTAYAAAGVAETNPMTTGFVAFRLGLAGFIVPYMFVFGPALLLQGTVSQIVSAIPTAILGCFLLALALVGWWRVRLNILMRLIAAGAALALIDPGWQTDIIGALIIVAIYIFIKTKEKSSSAHSVKNA